MFLSFFLFFDRVGELEQDTVNKTEKIDSKNRNKDSDWKRENFPSHSPNKYFGWRTTSYESADYNKIKKRKKEEIPMHFVELTYFKCWLPR